MSIGDWSADVCSADLRAAIQTEVTALVEQIDDIAERTTFNGTDLLTGDATTPTDPVTISIQTGVNDGETVDISIKALTAEALGVHDGTDPIDLSSAAGASAALTDRKRTRLNSSH